MKYWILENGVERKATKRAFISWLINFCTDVTTMEGYTIKKPSNVREALDNIYCGYNHQGVKVCGRMD